MSPYIRQLPETQLEFQMFVLDELADELIAKGADVIKITIGISELPVSDRTLKVFSDTIYDHNKTHVVYPQGLPELREAIAEYYNTNFKTNTSKENVIVNVGTSAIVRNLFQVLCKPGQEILIPSPYYCLYLLSAVLADAKITFYDIDPITQRVDFDSFKKVYDPDKTSIVIINTPGNPMGNIVTKEETTEIFNIVDGRSFIINDEIYNNTCFYSEFESTLSYLDKYKDINIVTNGFSKGFRMYTKRVGYAILPEQLIMPMRIVQQHTLLTADPVNQHGMVDALKDLDRPKELMYIYRDRAEYTYNTLKETGCNPIKSEGGFYIILDCTDWIKSKNMEDSKELAMDILQKVYVATVPGTDFGVPFGLRLAFCDSRYNEAIDRLADYFTEPANKLQKEMQECS
jgi:aspartate/methionine/tyrosine aminotransferase